MAAKTCKVLCKPDGTTVFVYDDALQPLMRAAGGECAVRRASHVEPTPAGRWNVDMTPVGGPASLGEYTTRSEALAAEVEWLNARLGVCKSFAGVR